MRTETGRMEPRTPCWSATYQSPRGLRNREMRGCSRCARKRPRARGRLELAAEPRDEAIPDPAQTCRDPSPSTASSAGALAHEGRRGSAPKLLLLAQLPPGSRSGIFTPLPVFRLQSFQLGERGALDLGWIELI